MQDRGLPHEKRIYVREDLAVLDLLEQPVWIFDITGKAMWWANAAAITLWSAESLEDLLDRNFSDDMSESTSHRLANYLVKFEKGERLHDQWTFYPNGKGPKTVATTASGILIEDGRMAMLMEGVYKDVMEESEKASLRGVEVLRHLPIAVCQFDIDGNVTDQNPEALAYFGSVATSPTVADVEIGVKLHRSDSDDNEDIHDGTCDEETNGTKNEDDCHFLNRFVDKELGRRVLEHVRDGHDSSIDALQCTVDGPRWATIRVRRTKDPVTSKPVILYIAKDISEVVEALKAKRKADLANTAKSEFLAVMAHEIRTPLHQVTGFMELLGQSQALEEEQRGYLKLMQSSSLSLMTVINDLLDFTKLEAGQMSIETIPFDAKAVVEGAMAVVRPKTIQKGVVLKDKLSDWMPGKVMGDPNRLRQILLNLLQNAVKFTENGAITVEVSTRTISGDDDKQDDDDERIMLRFAVSDTGIGISDEGRKRMFGKYQQADASVAAKYGGTGLGLSICKRLVEAMKGSIGLESELGVGSTFWFEIPFDLPPNGHNSNGRVGAVSECTSHSLDDDDCNGTVGCREVLLVEDNKVNQKLMVAMLHRLGHRVTVVDDGRKAVTEVERKMYDLVLMDVQMPVMDGIEATKIIRRMGFTKAQLPVLGLTASVQRMDHQEIGMNTWLTKPLRIPDLRKAIKTSLTPAVA